MDQRKTEVTDGGGEGTRVTSDKGTEGVGRSTTENDRGPVVRSAEKAVPRDETAMSKAIEDTEMESTNTEVGEATYLAELVREHSRVRDMRCGYVRAERQERGRSTMKFGAWQCRTKETNGSKRARVVGVVKGPIGGHAGGTKEDMVGRQQHSGYLLWTAKERSERTRSGRSGGASGLGGEVGHAQSEET